MNSLFRDASKRSVKHGDLAFSNVTSKLDRNTKSEINFLSRSHCIVWKAQPEIQTLTSYDKFEQTAPNILQDQTPVGTEIIEPNDRCAHKNDEQSPGKF